MTEKTWMVNSGNPIVSDPLQDDAELRSKMQDKTRGSVISGFNPTAGGVNTVTLSSGSILVEGRLLTTAGDTNHVLTDLTQDQIVYIYYDSSLDVAPDYDCLIVKNSPASTFVEPDTSPAETTCIPLAHVTVAGGVISTVFDITPRTSTWYIQGARPLAISTSDLLGFRGLLNINHKLAATTTLAHKNFALRTTMNKTYGYAQIINGRLLFEGELSESGIAIEYASGQDFIITNGDATKNFMKIGYYNGSGDDTRVEISAEQFLISASTTTLFSGGVTFGQTLSVSGDYGFEGKSYEYSQSKFTDHYFNVFTQEIESNHITRTFSMFGTSTLVTNDASGGFVHWLLLPNYAFQYGTTGTFKNKIKSMWFNASGTSSLQILEQNVDGSHNQVVATTSTLSTEIDIDFELEPDMQYVVRWSASADAVSLYSINIIIEEVYA